MKKIVLMSLIVVIASILVFGGCATPAPTPAPASAPISAPTSAPIKLTALSFESKNILISKWTYEFYQRVNAAAKGELTVDYRGGPEVISANDQFAAVQRGVIDMTGLTSALLTNDIPEVAALNLSQITPWEERAPGKLYGIIADVFKKFNIFYLGRGNSHFDFVLGSNKLIKNPHEDFKGLKFRGVPIYNPFFQRLGLTSVNLAPTEMYTSMQQHLIDGWANTMNDSVESYKLNEVTKYWIDHPFYTSGGLVILMNLDKWNQLPKPMQDLMTNTMEQTEHDMVDDLANVSASAKQKMINSGMQPITFSSEDAKWYLDQANESLWATIKAKVSPDMYDQLMKAVVK